MKLPSGPQAQLRLSSSLSWRDMGRDGWMLLLAVPNSIRERGNSDKEPWTTSARMLVYQRPLSNLPRRSGVLN